MSRECRDIRVRFVVGVRRHPLTRVQVFAVDVPTGSRTHPWLYSGIPSGIQPQVRDAHPKTGPSLKFRRSTFIFVLGHAAGIPPISNSPEGE
jgi:hypothetical protein